MIFPVDSTLLNLFFIGNVMWCHSNNFHLDSCSKWSKQSPSPVTICSRKASPPTSYWCKRSIMMIFLAPLYASLSIHGTQQAQNLELPSSSITVITMPLLVDIVKNIYPLLGDSCHVSVNKSSGCCQALLQCKGDYCTICHKALLLLFQPP
jgi:hypothetical protein